MDGKLNFHYFTTAMKTLICLLFLELSIVVAWSQDKKTKIINEVADWSEGSVMLRDGTELKGVLKYNDNIGLLSYESGSTSRSFTPKSVVGFEFFDESKNQQRVFYSLEDKDPKTEAPRYYYFEVLKEFKTFAVLSKVEPLEVNERSGGGAPNYNPITGYTPGYTYSRTDIVQVETIFFMSSEGKLFNYLKIEERDIEDGIFDRKKTKNKLVNEGLMQQFTGEYYAELEGFADDNDLSFKRKTDLIKILDRYEQLTSN
jgi:hypothetical protein